MEIRKPVKFFVCASVYVFGFISMVPGISTLVCLAFGLDPVIQGGIWAQTLLAILGFFLVGLGRHGMDDAI